MPNELGAGNGSGYPTEIDQDITAESASTAVRAAVPNDLASAIIAIQTELGVNPAGSLLDVVTYLQTEHGADGTHDNTIVALLAGTQTITGNKTLSGTNTLSGTFNYTAPVINPATACFIKDDFTGSPEDAVSVSNGELGWFTLSTTGVAAVSSAATTANHPGVWTIKTDANSGDDQGIYLGASSTVLPADTFDITVIVNLNTAGQVTYQIGLVDGDTTVTSPSDGIYFQFIAASDTNWFGVTRAASTETRTDTSTAVGSGWDTLRIRRVDASTIGFTVNGGTEVTSTTNIPTAALNMYIALETNTTSSKTMDVDYFHMLVSGITR